MGISDEAAALAAELARQRLHIVFAESCTAGLASALLAASPGISEWHCGSAVTYRSPTKTAWLGVAEEDLEKFTAVSEPVAHAMAVGVLERTPEADIAVSITGHLGPDAPEGFDGVVFIGSARRAPARGQVLPLPVARVTLQTASRTDRQQEAARRLLEHGLTACRVDEVRPA